MFYQYLQWQIDIQLSAAQKRARDRHLSIGLYHDLALATDSFGSDLWAHRPFYVAGCRVGSPPDDFSPKGQDWGFPPPNARRHREDGYRLFAESIRKNCRHGGALRIDHVMRLFRLFWIPDGSDATEGAYVRELSRISCAFWRWKACAIRWWWWAKTWGRWSRRCARRWRVSASSATGCSISRRIPTANSAATKSTRARRWFRPPRTICPRWPVSGWAPTSPRAAPRGPSDEKEFDRTDRAARRRKAEDARLLFEQNLLAPELPRPRQPYPELTGPLHNAVVGFLALTPSQLLAINQEDLTKELAQQNLPGTTWQYPNWGRKMRFTVEQLRCDPEARGYTAMFRNWIVNSGRKNDPPQ
jgi:4-alpha-glucanotransferase